MPTERPACSEAQSAAGNRRVEAAWSKPASHGYSFSYEDDLYGGGKRYWNMQPSKQALAREREKLRAMTGYNQCGKPLPELVKELNIHLRGWANYFSKGYPAKAYRQINYYVGLRVSRHLGRRSQRPWKGPEGITLYEYLHHRLGLINL